MSETDPYNQGKDKANAIKELVRSLNISECEGDLTFMAAVILLYGVANNTVSALKIKKATDYHYKTVCSIIDNFRSNGVIINCYTWIKEVSAIMELGQFEICLYAMCGTGEIIQSEQGFQTNYTPNNKIINLMI